MKDIKQDSILKSLGYKVIRLSESKIKESAQQCIKYVLSEV